MVGALCAIGSFSFFNTEIQRTLSYTKDNNSTTRQTYYFR